MDRNAKCRNRILPTARASRGTAGLLGSLLAAGLVGACTAGGASAAVAIDPLVAHACGVTMGLAHSPDQYDLCVGSLRNARASIELAEAARQHEVACATRGLQPETPGYASCVLRLEQPRVAGVSGDAK
jgi:hypothetical protein